MAKIEINFSVPFDHCRECIGFTPMVERSNWRLENLIPKCEERYYCKGENFCKYREQLKEFEDGN